MKPNPTKRGLREKIETEIVTFGQIMQRVSPESADRIKSAHSTTLNNIESLFTQELKLLIDELEGSKIKPPLDYTVASETFNAGIDKAKHLIEGRMEGK